MISIPVFQVFEIKIKSLPILIVSGFILIYNILIYYITNKTSKIETDYQNKIYGNVGKLQIILDYIAFIFVLYFIGGLHSNLFYILTFHIILGVIILTPRFITIVTALAILMFILLSILEYNQIIPYYNIFNDNFSLSIKYIILQSIIHTGIIVSILTIMIMLINRLRSDNLKLAEARDVLEENLESLKILEIRKSKFMRYSAHQLRSPLATISAVLDVLTKKKIPLESERAFNILMGAHEKSSSLLELVNELLELSRIREGKNQITLSDSIDLVLLIETVVFLLNSKIKISNNTIIRNYSINEKSYSFNQLFTTKEDYQKDLSVINPRVFVKGNLKSLNDAFYNVIENAIKYSNDGSNIIINLIIDEVHHKYYCEITDEGIGIDLEYIDDIFLEFVRSPNAKDHQNDGTGLGLSITREILMAHRASISVQSELNKSTTFTITFKKAEDFELK